MVDFLKKGVRLCKQTSWSRASQRGSGATRTHAALSHQLQLQAGEIWQQGNVNGSM